MDHNLFLNNEHQYPSCVDTDTSIDFYVPNIRFEKTLCIEAPSTSNESQHKEHEKSKKFFIFYFFKVAKIRKGKEKKK